MTHRRTAVIRDRQPADQGGQGRSESEQLVSTNAESVSFVQLEPIEKGETVPDGLTARLDYKSVQTAVDGLRCTVTIELQTRRESSTTHTTC